MSCGPPALCHYWSPYRQQKTRSCNWTEERFLTLVTVIYFILVYHTVVTQKKTLPLHTFLTFNKAWPNGKDWNNDTFIWELTCYYYVHDTALNNPVLYYHTAKCLIPVTTAINRPVKGRHSSDMYVWHSWFPFFGMTKFPDFSSICFEFSNICFHTFYLINLTTNIKMYLTNTVQFLKTTEKSRKFPEFSSILWKSRCWNHGRSWKLHVCSRQLHVYTNHTPCIIYNSSFTLHWSAFIRPCTTANHHAIFIHIS